MLTIARLTIVEAARRRLLVALLLLTAAIVALTGWGFSRLWLIHSHGQPIGEVGVRLIASQALILIVFCFTGVLALSSTLVASPSIAAEVESGQVLALLSRPLRRSQYVLGKWLGLAALVVAYAIAAGVGELLVVDWVTGYAPPHPVQLLGYVAAVGITLLTLSLLFSTRLSGMTGGVIALAGYFGAWIGGVLGGIGEALDNDALRQAGTISHLLLPTDGLWKGAIWTLEPASVIAGIGAAGNTGAGNPFFAANPPSAAYLAWCVAWVAGLLGLTIWSFRRRQV